MYSKERELLIQLRKIKGLSQEKVAERLAITTSHYGMIEKGVRTPSLILAQKIASLFNKHIEEIFFPNNISKTLEKKKHSKSA